MKHPRNVKVEKRKKRKRNRRKRDKCQFAFYGVGSNFFSLSSPNSYSFSLSCHSSRPTIHPFVVFAEFLSSGLSK